jgi:hypothetical protein
MVAAKLLLPLLKRFFKFLPSTVTQGSYLYIKTTCHPWWTADHVTHPSRFVDAGGKIGKEDLHENSFLGFKEMRDKYNDVGVIHFQTQRYKEGSTNT